MCGILGSINFTINKELLNSIRHRGPDDSGYIQTEINGNQIFLGHRRLSIVDLSLAGHQPMTSSSGKSIIIFNGEIYNHLDLRKEISSVEFNGHSDTETIVNYLEKFGREGIEKLNGIFAFAYLDYNKRTLYLARDRFGVKPLYYYLSGKHLIFSSEIRPIRNVINLEVDINLVAEFLRYRYNPAPNTIWKNLYKLRPGHCLKVDLDGFKIEEFPFVTKKIKTQFSGYHDALDEYGSLFEQAVKRQLMADVEIGILLSGGIDSALIAHFAQKHYSGRVKTFTVGFNEEDISNELIEARETSRVLDTEHHEIVIGKSDFINLWADVNKIVEEPSGTTSQIPMYYLLQTVSKHVKVVLTGQGADEPLGGYARYLGERYLFKIPPAFYRLFLPLRQRIKWNEKLYRSIYAYSERDVISRFDKVYALFDDNELRELIDINTTSFSRNKWQYFFDMLSLSNVSSFQAMLSIDTRTSLGDDLLLYTDKVSMHFSVETRVPILDNDLVDFIETLPPKMKISFFKRKYIHKKFAEKLLPKEIVSRKKRGFYSPTRKWFTKDLLKQIEERIISDGVLDFLKEKTIKKIFSEHYAGIKNNEKQIFQILSLYNVLKS